MASSTALTTLAEVIAKLTATCFWTAPNFPIMDVLSFGFQKANAAVLRMGLTMKELRGMERPAPRLQSLRGSCTSATSATAAPTSCATVH